MRWLAMLVSLLVLSGCNLVTSEQPWFGTDASRDAPRLRNGLWVFLAEPAKCRVDFNQAAYDWDDCADPIVVRDNEWLELQWEQSVEGSGRRREFVGSKSIPALLAGGEPAVLQLFQAGNGEARSRYYYTGVRPTATDQAGGVTALSLWLVQCGPLNEQAMVDGGLESDTVSTKPFPGLIVSGDGCIAESVGALRNAARKSEELPQRRGGASSQMRWVRQSWP
jgi:hypothetical protein